MNYTKYEKARILGARALQISMGAPFTVKLSEKELEALKYDPLEIARKEFDEGVIPIEIKREVKKARVEEAKEEVKEEVKEKNE